MRLPRPACSRVFFASFATATLCLLLLAFVDGDDGPSAKSDGLPPAGTSATVIAWNDLGMHCLDPDFSVFAILPPFNTINAQLIVDGELQTSGYNLSYEALADPSGSINRTSVGKTNFWSHVGDLFGVNPAPDVGLTGTSMPGLANVPQPLNFDPAHGWYQVEGIPLTPIDDAQQKNPYPLVRVVARNAQNQIVATSNPTAPNSTELECSFCHASGGSPFARPSAGWVKHPDPLKDDRFNILRLHDERQLGTPAYDAALSQAGYSAAGLFSTVVNQGTAILCSRCHGTNALPGTGLPGITPLTQAIHGGHANVVDSKGVTLDQEPTRVSCFLCHPGRDTQCLRGAMGKAIGPDGKHAMHCQSCHGNMSDVGSPTRVGWLDQPSCQMCHTGTATQNAGAIRFSSVFDATGTPHVPATQTFATTPDTPAAGFSLYRFSTGHHDLQCAACHGPPHAIYPTSEANDNLQSVSLQGHVGTITDCSVCHDSLEDDEYQGPHGMHPVVNKWVRDNHKNAVEEDGLNSCRVCHGADLSGTVLSLAQGDRSYSNSLGNQTLFRGQRVGCWNCHDGPNDDDPVNNLRPVVSSFGASTPNDVSLPLLLTGTDGDGDPLVFRIISQPTSGSVALSGQNATFLPMAGFVGTTSFTYAAWDGKSDSNLGTVTLTVTPAQCGTIAVYGFGFPGSGSLLPQLSVTGCATPGSNLVLSVDQALGGAPLLLGVGTSRANQELGNGLTLRLGGLLGVIDGITLDGSGPGGGTMTLPVALPAGFPSGTFTLQVAVVDPGAIGGLASTNAVEVVIP